jgi:hypothetical protein
LRLRLRLAAVLSVTALSSAGVAALPSAVGHEAFAAACESQHNSVQVVLSASKYPETTDHISDAIAAGQPSLLHIDRADEDAHRAASLADYPPRSGLDRDEYVPAVSAEGGAGPTSATSALRQPRCGREHGQPAQGLVRGSALPHRHHALSPRVRPTRRRTCRRLD